MHLNSEYDLVRKDLLIKAQVWSGDTSSPADLSVIGGNKGFLCFAAGKWTCIARDCCLTFAWFACHLKT